MSTQTDNNRTYTIMEAAKLSGLPESTLRYYETIGIIDPIKRDASSKHRVYSEADINLIVGLLVSAQLACQSTTCVPISAMRIGEKVQRMNKSSCLNLKAIDWLTKSAI